MTFGMRPYADNTFYVIGIEKGWFNDVGITIEPQPYGLKTTENQWVSILLNQQVDINTATCSILLPSYKTTDQLKCTGFAVTFFGSVMLANPKLGLKTVRDYAEGRRVIRRGASPGAGRLWSARRSTFLPPSPRRSSTRYRSSWPASSCRTTSPWTTRRCCCSRRATGSTSCTRAGRRSRRRCWTRAGRRSTTPGSCLEFGPGGVNSPLEPLVFNNGWGLDRRLRQQ